MPWARFDDHMPNHRKIRPLTDAAFRLWVSAVCWCNANRTDGIVFCQDLTYVSDTKRPRKAVAELVETGLWEEIDGGWRIHDFLDYNPSKSQVDAERKRKTEAQKRWRDGLKTNDVDASTDTSTGTHVDASVATSRPAPSRVLPTEVPQQGTPRGERPTAAPAGATPLIDALAAEGFVVSWDLGLVDWDRVRLAVEKSGIPAMVEYARRRNAAAKSPAYSARAWVQGWSTLPTLDSNARITPAPPPAIGAPSEAAAMQPPPFRQLVAEGRAFKNTPAELDFGDAFRMPE